VAVTSGTWPIVGVGLFGRPEVWIEAMVAIDDCELERVGLPGRRIKGAGDGCDGGTRIGDAFVKEGEAVAVGVGIGVVLADDAGRGIAVEMTGWLYVGWAPV